MASALASSLWVSTLVLLLLHLLLLAHCETVAESSSHAMQSAFATNIKAQSNAGYQRQQGHQHSGLHQSDCPSACSYRCSKTSKRKPCMFFCNKCCLKCLCVPPGTYGNKQVCPCYNDWKTQQGGPKCP